MRSNMKLVAKALTLGSALALAPALATPVMAQDSETSIHAGSVEVPVNKSQVITADRAISRAMIGNDEIADIFPISDRSVYVLGKKLGTTSLTLYDSRNNVMAVMDVAVGPDVISLREQVNALMPDEQIDARISNESIVLSGTVSSAGAADKAVQLARAYAGDNVVNLMSMGGSQQVMLEVRFAEVSRSVGKELGVRSFMRSNGGRFSGVTGTGASLTPGEVPTGTFGNGVLEVDSVTGAFGIITRSFGDVLGLNVDVALDALEEKGMSKTLAEPTLVALSGERAAFLAGGEFPIPVAQAIGGQGGGAGGGGSAAITVEFKPFGVSLGFTPTVLSDDTINLLVEPEVSSIDPSASISVGGLTIPGLQVRRASTMLELRDGESFAIAGLIQQDFETTVEQVPLLGSLPIIGSLFRSSGFRKGETELLIVVTPRLVQPIRPDQVRLPTDRVADPVQADVLLNGTMYRPQPVAPNGSVPTSSDASANAAEEDGYDY
ncbi:type II and III secretion system protein family protein [Altererythrobacter lutimaris]|uniref:Type II and III secretion system protein family protein n=1 Tax=Altererythrobacter lutimaris TaxID=2743979 RepID=A0A850H4U1_9SPHN|nr:type II and III secretion system protein family protein [Altererythrobacter lutimaris]NVE94177.1 type II and III secretion system protein family protein [Altererythrobacter lutimaris]